MTKDNQNQDVELHVRDLIQALDPSEAETREYVERVMRRARQTVSMRDMLVFSFSHLLVAALTVLSAAFRHSLKSDQR